MWCRRIFRLWKLQMQEKISWRMYWKYWWKIVGMALFEHETECVWPYTICVVLAIIVLTISIWIGGYCAYKCMNHVKKNCY